MTENGQAWAVGLTAVAPDGQAVATAANRLLDLFPGAAASARNGMIELTAFIEAVDLGAAMAVACRQVVQLLGADWRIRHLSGF